MIFRNKKNWIKPWVYLSLAIFLLAACRRADTVPVVSEITVPAPSPTSAPAEPEVLDSPTQTPFPPVNTPAEPQPTVPPNTPTEAPPSALTETPPTDAASFPDPAAYQWQPVAGGFARPIDLAHAGDGTGRLFVAEQRGVIWVIQDGQVLDTPFLDIQDRVTQLGSPSDERGLLGLVFHPQYAETGDFFVNYTDRQGTTQVARFTRTEDPNRADPGSEFRLLTIGQPYGNHNGGDLTFGPDGMLYIAMGDGGSAGDPQGNGQSLQTLLGKLLRIDVDREKPYAVPDDNPFRDGGGAPEIWAYGLRNPWRIAFDILTGDLYIADVGQNAWEEVNFLPANAPGGANFGWDYREGRHAYEGSPPGNLLLVEPVAEYSHGPDCSVSGGEVYRGTALPAWYGIYLYGDFCTGRVWGLLQGEPGDFRSELLFDTDARISSFGLDEAGELYLVDHRGEILRLEVK